MQEFFFYYCIIFLFFCLRKDVLIAKDKNKSTDPHPQEMKGKKINANICVSEKKICSCRSTIPYLIIYDLKKLTTVREEGIRGEGEGCE